MGVGWSELAAELVTPAPIGTLSSSIAYDRARGYTLAFTHGETWAWDGTAWTLKQPANPPAIADWSETSMAYDARRGVAVLFSRYADNNTVAQWKLWEWNGIDWIAKGTTPHGYRLFYDPLRGRVVLIASGVYTAQYESWAWDGTTWTELTAAPDPKRPELRARSSEPAVVLVGGGTRWDTWTAKSDSTDPRDQCDGTDVDGDSLMRCADPYCWWRCDPLCAPGETACDPNRPRCGDGTCSAIESAALCPADCP